MFSRTFTYTGYDGKPHTDTWWFNLSEAELYEMELSKIGGVNGMMNRLLREEKPGEIVKMFKEIILGAVGERSADGRKFLKNEEIRQDFYQSKAYSDLFVELVSSGEALSTFLRGAIPEDVRLKLEAADKEAAEAAPEQIVMPLPVKEEGKTE